MTKDDITRENLKEKEREVEKSRERYVRMKALADRQLTEARNRYELEKRKILSELGEEKELFYKARERLRTFKKYHRL